MPRIGRPVRLSMPLYQRAMTCARLVEVGVAEYARICCVHERRGTFRGIDAPSPALVSAPRKPSMVVVVEPGLGTPAEIRLALARGVLYAESRRQPAYVPPGQPGKDYVICQKEGQW